jgi:N-glycosyltransferase
MRVLCTINGSPSHTRSMVPITRALADAGHDVLIAVAPELAPGVRGERHVEISECLTDPIETILMRGRELNLRGPNTKGGTADADAAQTRLGGIIEASMWPESTKALLPLAEDFRPDIVVRDDFEFAGYLVAETLRVPHVAVTGGLTNQVDPARLPDPMLVHGPGLGLEPRPEAGLYRYGRIDYMAPSYSFAAKTGPARLAYCQPVLRRPGDTLPAWLANRDRPLVLAAVGTALNRIKRCEQYGVALPDWFDPAKPIRTMAAALSEVDCTAVLTTGGIPVGDISHGDDVHLVTDIAQPLVLEVADLLVTHGGYNSVRESIRAGVPMVVQPGSADQPHNARRVAEFGLGVAVPDADAGQLAQACRTVLADSRYALAAQGAKRAMLTLPDPAAVADDLVRLISA